MKLSSPVQRNTRIAVLILCWLALALPTGMMAADPVAPTPRPKRDTSMDPPIGPMPNGMIRVQHGIYDPAMIKTREQMEALLPNAVFDESKDLVDIYWAAFHFHGKAVRGRLPSAGERLVPWFADAAYSGGIFQWDTCFMTMFNKYGWDSHLATVESLNNFYQVAALTSNGLTQHCLSYYGDGGTGVGPNVIGWAEWEHYLMTGDKDRLRYAVPFLVKNFNEYRRSLDRNKDMGYRQIGVGVEALSWNAWGNVWPLKTLMDVAAQQAFSATNIADMAQEIDDQALAKEFHQYAEEHNRHIQKVCWNEETGFFHHQLSKGGFHPPFQIMGYFPLLSGAATPAQAARMVRHLYDPLRFQKDLPVPTTGTCDKRLVDISPNRVKPDRLGMKEFGLHSGIYWSGGVWAPTNWIVIRALERNGYHAATRDIVERYLANTQHVYRNNKTKGFMSKTGFPRVFPERHDGPRKPSPDGAGCAVWNGAEFTGWTGLLPISGLVEQLIGIQANAPANEIVWRPQSLDRHGLTKLRFGPATTSLVMAHRASYTSPAVIDITTDKPFRLRVISRGAAFERQVPAGTTRWEVGVVPSQFAPDPGVSGKATAPTVTLPATLSIDGVKLGLDQAAITKLFEGVPGFVEELTCMGSRYGWRQRVYPDGGPIEIIYGADGRAIFVERYVRDRRELKKAFNPAQIRADWIAQAGEPATIWEMEGFKDDAFNIAWGDYRDRIGLPIEHGDKGQSAVLQVVNAVDRNAADQPHLVGALADGPGLELQRRHIDAIIAANAPSGKGVK